MSRQFLPVSRQRIESLLGTFPRLLQAGQQHTYVETEEVRFVYQPLEAHYLVMITNKASNILQDMETLHLLGRIVAEHVAPSGEETELVQHHALEILLAFDEIVCLGHRTHVNMTQLHTILAMESQEEIVQEIIAKNKMHEAKEMAKRKIKQIEMEKREAARRAAASKSSTLGGGYAPVSSSGSTRLSPELTPRQTTTTLGSPPIQTTARHGGKGMKLGKKSAAIE